MAASLMTLEFWYGPITDNPPPDYRPISEDLKLFKDNIYSVRDFFNVYQEYLKIPEYNENDLVYMVLKDSNSSMSIKFNFLDDSIEVDGLV